MVIDNKAGSTHWPNSWPKRLANLGKPLVKMAACIHTLGQSLAKQLGQGLAKNLRKLMRG